jgi:hypothetical protein
MADQTPKDPPTVDSPYDEDAARAEFDAKVQRALDGLHQQYRKTRNPIYVWKAINAATSYRPATTLLPTWVLAYLQHASGDIVKLSLPGEELYLSGQDELGWPQISKRERVIPRKGRIATAIVEALRFKQPGKTGRVNPLAEPTQIEQAVDIAGEFYRLRIQGRSEKATKKDLAEKHHISESAVKEYWDTHKHNFNPPLPDARAKKSPTKKIRKSRRL